MAPASCPCTSSRIHTTCHLPALPGAVMPDALDEALVQQQGVCGGGQLPLVGVQPVMHSRIDGSSMLLIGRGMPRRQQVHAVETQDGCPESGLHAALPSPRSLAMLPGLQISPWGCDQGMVAQAAQQWLT